MLVDNEVRREKVASNTCGVMGIAPGLHELSITAVIQGVPASVSQVVTITAAQAAKVNLTLVKIKAAAH